MGKTLAKSYVYAVIAFIFGLLLTWAAAQDTAGQSAEDVQSQQWRMSLYGTGLLFMVLAIVGDIILHMIFEYKILGRK